MRCLTRTAAVFIIILFCRPASAQTFSVSTDLLGYARLGTMNLDISYSVSRRWSLVAGARYNPFTFRKDDPQRQFQLRQLSCSAGVRMWPWHAGSGWWLAGKVRYQEYNEGGVVSRKTEEGDRFGTGFYAGYTHMLSSHFNLEFGFGLWAGVAFYRQYSCPACGDSLSSGSRFFISPDDFMISVAYVF
jgi:hypothetical protein